MSTIIWLANLGQRRRAADSLRSIHMPRRPMTQEMAARHAELMAERKRLVAGDLVRDELAAGSIDFMLRTQDALHARQLAIAWKWAMVLAVLLSIVSATLLALTFAFVGPL